MDNGGCHAHSFIMQCCLCYSKVESSGLISIVHSPNVLLSGQEVHESVNSTNQNLFKIKWDGDIFPSVEDGCGTCLTQDNGCLCDVAVFYEKNFETTFPTYDQVLAQLKIGSIPEQWIPQEYTNTRTQNAVQMWNKDSSSTDILLDTIFGVEVGGEMKYFINSKSTVTVDNGSGTQYSFRNPPSLMSIIDQKSIGAYYETEALMDMYLNHDNTPPFMASRLIKRFVTSNPR